MPDLAASSLVWFVALADVTGAFCTAPIEPSCVDDALTYERNVNSERCAKDVRRFATQIEEYVACLRTNIGVAQERQQAIEEMFECKRKGRDDCGDGDDRDAAQ